MLQCSRASQVISTVAENWKNLYQIQSPLWCMLLKDDCCSLTWRQSCKQLTHDALSMAPLKIGVRMWVKYAWCKKASLLASVCSSVINCLWHLILAPFTCATVKFAKALFKRDYDIYVYDRTLVLSLLFSADILVCACVFRLDLFRSEAVRPASACQGVVLSVTLLLL